MTDEEAIAYYKRLDPVEWAHADVRWRREAVEAVLEAAHAKNYDEAVKVLRKHGWGKPEECAKEIRQAKACPHCDGTGIVEPKD